MRSLPVRPARAAALASLAILGGLAVVSFPAGARAGSSSPAPEARIELGRRLFFDPAVSRSGNNSCASCHDPEKAFSDPRRVSDDDFLSTKRHSQTLVDAGDRNAYHWDGEFDTVEELVTARLGVPSGLRSGYGLPPPSVQPQPTVTLEDDAGRPHVVDLRTMTPVAELVERDGRYGDAFQAAFGSRRVTTARLAESIAAFVRSIRHAPSAYDRYAQGDHGALSESAHRGLELFRGRAHCAHCHHLSPSPAPFTDDQFHDTGVSRRTALRSPRVPGTGADAVPGLEEDKGHGRLTGVPNDAGSFKTPTLRDVALRGPYMHDGSFASLEEVVRHYAKGGTPNPFLDPVVKPFAASDQDVADLVAFLESLSGASRPAPALDWVGRARRTRLRIVDAEGHAVAGLPVRVLPEGDRLPGDAPATSPERDLETDAEGFLEFQPPRRTHARLVLPDGLRLAQGEWVPDTCERADLVTPVRGRSFVAVRFPAGAEPPKRLAAAFAESRTATSGREAPFALPWAQPASRAIFLLEGVVSVGGRPLARYASWVRSDAPKSATLEVPVGAALERRGVSLEAGRQTRLDLEQTAAR